MRKPKGPQLKAPELRAPRFLVDLFYDLHDRRLLPLVALVTVAILAVPVLLGEEEIAPPPAPPTSSAISPPGSEVARLTVVEAAPGLRDYRKRLAGRTPTNPFQQRYTGPVLKESRLGGEITTTSTSSLDDTTTTTTTTSTDFVPSGSSGGDGGGDGDGPRLVFYTFAIDVKIVRVDGDGRAGDPSIKRGVRPATPLPGPKAPVVTYMGARFREGKALLMVSNNVKSIFGDGKCLSGTDTCQLLEVETGFPQTFVYGAGDARYRINVLRIEPVVTGRS